MQDILENSFKKYSIAYHYLFMFFIQNEEDKRLQEELLQAIDVLKVNKF